jgi:hypothetical protein
MSFGNLVDFTLATGQCVLALLLWHQAEPRMREARGRMQAACTLALGFVLAMSFPIAFARGIADAPMSWQLTMRDAFLVLYGGCMYRQAMRVKPVVV